LRSPRQFRRSGNGSTADSLKKPCGQTTIEQEEHTLVFDLGRSDPGLVSAQRVLVGSTLRRSAKAIASSCRSELLNMPQQ
jgi:hypothetical protein